MKKPPAVKEKGKRTSATLNDIAASDGVSFQDYRDSENMDPNKTPRKRSRGTAGENADQTDAESGGSGDPLSERQ